MNKKAKRLRKSTMDVASASSNSVQNGLESIKSAASKVVEGAAKISRDVAAKAKSVVADIVKMVK